MNNFLEQLVKKTGVFLIVLLTIVLLLGLAVLAGMKAEVVTLVNHLFAGTVKLIEVVEFLAKTWEKLVHFLKEALVVVSPLLAGLLGLAGYVGIMFFYKLIGQSVDIALVTVLLTVVLALLPPLIWPARQAVANAPTGFWRQWRGKMSIYLLNAYEIVLFVFFLTLDWENPFFLPRHLWGQMRASLGGIDLMSRGFNYHNAFVFTLWLAGLAVFVEVLRQIIKILVKAQKMQALPYPTSSKMEAKIVSFKERLKLSFNSSLDDLTRFLGYITLVVLVFFLFPRLKLLSLIVFSFTTLVWDLLHQDRLLADRQHKDILTLLADKIVSR